MAAALVAGAAADHAGTHDTVAIAELGDRVPGVGDRADELVAENDVVAKIAVEIVVAAGFLGFPPPCAASNGEHAGRGGAGIIPSTG